MKIPARIFIPAGLALGIGIAVGGLFLWQIQTSVNTIESSFSMQGSGMFKKMLTTGTRSSYPDSSMQSQALIQLKQGEIFELKGEWKHAEEKYAESALSGGGAPALRKLAAIQLQRREFDDAEATIEKLKDENPDSDDVLLLQGILALRRGNTSQAEAVFKRKPESPQSLYGMALVAIANNDSVAAKDYLTRAGQSDDPAIRSTADVVMQAYTEFALFPQGQPIHLATLIARSLAQVNECETALKLINPVVVTQPSYRDAWIVKGFCEFNTERTRDALTSLEQAYALDPEKPEIQYFLARTHAALGDPQNAVTFLQYAILNGFMPEQDARNLLSDYALEQGNTDLALEQYRIMSENKDSDLDAFRKYVDLAVTMPNHGLDALAVAKNALARWPDDTGALTIAAKAALAAGLPGEANKYVESALKIDPKNKEAIGVQEAIKKAGAPVK